MQSWLVVAGEEILRNMPERSSLFIAGSEYTRDAKHMATRNLKCMVDECAEDLVTGGRPFIPKGFAI